MVKEHQNSLSISNPLNDKNKKRYIKSNPKAVSKYIRAIQGSRSQTKQLNINIKSLTLKYLLSLTKTRQFDESQIKVIETYQKISASFTGTHFLFNSREDNYRLERKQQISYFDVKRYKIKKKCFDYYSSIKLVSEIIKSQKMFMTNKIAMIKYLSTIRQGVYLNLQGDSTQFKQRNDKTQLKQAGDKTQQENQHEQNKKELQIKKYIKKRQWKNRPFQFVLNKKVQKNNHN